MLADGRLHVDGEKYYGVDFSNRKISTFVATSSEFVNCRFERMKLDEACFGGGTRQSTYIHCSFNRSRLTSRAPGNTRFESCTFEGVEITELFCTTVEFVDCTFSGVIRKAVINASVPGADREAVGRLRNRVVGNDFSEAELFDIAFRTGVDLFAQRLPSGPNYLLIRNAETAIREVRSRVIEWRDLGKRRDCMAVIQSLERELRGGQEQLFISRRGFSGRLRRALDSIAELL